MGGGRKRRRGGELRRVAEIVMVLAAAGEVRGGRAPTSAERALAAEARGQLAESVGEGAARPRELFPREAVRALVEDLGLGRARDPAAMGFRPPRASIAERLLLTERKMEEVKEAPVPPVTNVPQTTASNATAELQGFHGAPKFTGGAPRNLSAIASLTATTPVTSFSPVILKQPRLNETQSGGPPLKPAPSPSIVALPNVCTPHLKLEKDVNATSGQANKSLHDTAARSNLSAVQSSSQAGKTQDTKVPAIQAVTGNVMGHKTPAGVAFVHPQSIFTKHNGIAKSVQQILHKLVNHPSWTPPSNEYMHAQLECQICMVAIMDGGSLLVCDACERGAHLKCLQQHYGNKGIPKAEWYCPTCLAQSKGKPLPPKYGKVTRTIVAPKATERGSSAQLSSGRAIDTTAAKDNCQNVATNGTVIKQNSTPTDSTAHDVGMLALNAIAVGLESQSVSTSEFREEHVNHAETSCNEKEGNGPPCSSVVLQTVQSTSELEISRLPTCSSTGTPSERSSTQTENSGSPSCAVNSVNDFVLHSAAISEVECSGHSLVASEEKHQPAHSELDPSTDVKMTNNGIPPTDQTHQANRTTDHGVKEPSNGETCEDIGCDDATSGHGRAHEAASNGVSPEPEVIGDPKDEVIGCRTARSVVDWVGDALKVVHGKTYYGSCNIDGLLYNLQDHILIASKDNKSSPSKLQSLWEEHDSRSKLAMVKPYCLASEISESVSKPCTAEDNEVYASNDQRVIMASAICGPCGVMQVDKFREEIKRRSPLVSSDSRLYPIFFCRWNYDESTGSFDNVHS